MSLSVRQHLNTVVAVLALSVAAATLAPAAQAKGQDTPIVQKGGQKGGHKGGGGLDVPQGPKGGQQADSGNQNDDRGNDRGGGRGRDRRSDDDRRGDRLDRLARPGDLKILDALGRTIKVVSRGHDVVIDQPDNSYVHYWYGNNGRYYMVYTNNDKGWTIGFVMVNGVWQPVPPPPPKPKKRSFISLYDPETNKTYTRIWPAGGGVITAEEDGDQRDKYDHK
jgi:hypothetical protein